MDFGDVIGFYFDNVLYIVMILIVLKLIIPLWYRPNRKRFILKSFFRIFPPVAYSTRDQENPKWPFFRAVHNLVTILLYSLAVLWALLELIIVLSQIKTGIRSAK